MPTRDQLELIRTTGEIEFYDLDPKKGTTNIGCDPENDIVIEGPDVAPVHAVLFHAQRPYQVMSMNGVGGTTLRGEPLPPTVSREISHWDTIEIAGHTLILLESETVIAEPGAMIGPAEPGALMPQSPVEAFVVPAAPLPATPAAAPQAVGLPARPPDESDEYIVIELSEREWTIDADQTVVPQVTIRNGGPRVAAFEVRVEGLDPDWVVIYPAQINLNEGDAGTVHVSITPPRSPTSRAGVHHFAVVVTSREYPGRRSQRGATLTVNAYYHMTVGDLHPGRQTVYGPRPTGQTTVQIANKGNSHISFRLEGSDDENACDFEFPVPGEATKQARQVDVRLASEETASVPIDITPRTRRLIGLRSDRYNLTVAASLLEGAGTRHEKRGELIRRPLIGPWHIAVLALGLALLIIILFWPRVRFFSADPQMVDAGQTSQLRWSASPFAKLRIDNNKGPVEGQVDGPIGAKEVSPEETTTYTLIGENILSRLFGNVIPHEQEVTIAVNPIRPEIRTFSAIPDSILTGEEATLSWEVFNADTLVLETNGSPETILSDKHIDRRQVAPDDTTTYVLIATNHYGEDKKNKEVKVSIPTPTPVPPPVVLRFDVRPLEITVGESVQINWEVSEAETVSIQPVSDKFPPNGLITHSPQEAGTIEYVLSARNGDEEVTELRQVKVNAAPTPTPTPAPPVIDSFTANPDEIVKGEDSELAWVISGETTNIQIDSTELGTLSGLPKSSTQSVSPAESAVYILTAFNGDLSVSATASIKVNEPPPDKPKIVDFRAKATKESGVVFEQNNQFYTEVGTEVSLVWIVENEPDEVSLTINDSVRPAPSNPMVDFPIGVIDENTAITLQAKNVSGSAVASLQILVKTTIPPPPANFRRVGNQFQWDYPSGDVNKISGFRIYRIDEDQVKELAAEIDLPAYQWDIPAGECGIYFVVAYYYDPLDRSTKETDAAVNSVGVPCPP